MEVELDDLQSSTLKDISILKNAFVGLESEFNFGILLIDLFIF